MESQNLLEIPFANPREARSSARYNLSCEDRGNIPFVILQYTLSGRGCFRMISQTREVPAGHAFLSILPEKGRYFFPPGVREPWVFSWVNFYGDLALRIWKSFRQQFGPVVPLAPRSEASLALAKLIQKIVHRSFRDRFEASEEALAFYMRWLRELQEPKRREKDIAAIVDFCGEHYHEPLTIKELADHAGFTREHLTRLFTKTEGISPARFLREKRLEAARQYLRESSLPLSEVALRCGFSSTRRFIASFRRKYRTPPTPWRRQNLSKHF